MSISQRVSFYLSSDSEREKRKNWGKLFPCCCCCCCLTVKLFYDLFEKRETGRRKNIHSVELIRAEWKESTGCLYKKILLLKLQAKLIWYFSISVSTILLLLLLLLLQMLLYDLQMTMSFLFHFFYFVMWICIARGRN